MRRSRMIYSSAGVNQRTNSLMRADCRNIVLSILLALLPLAGVTAEQTEGLWARATVPGADTGAVYGRLRNAGGEPLVIVGIETSMAEKAEIHVSSVHEGMSRMEHTPRLQIEAGESARLEPGGRHIMLMGLNEPLRKGASFDIELLLEDGARLRRQVLIGGIGQMTVPGGEP